MFEYFDNLMLQDLATGKVSEETYDAVFVCTGHHASKNIPDFPGMKDFKGKIVHTHDYKVSLMSLLSQFSCAYMYIRKMFRNKNIYLKKRSIYTDNKWT